MSLTTPAPASQAINAHTAPIVQPLRDDLSLMIVAGAVMASTAIALSVTVIAMVVSS